jgi:hypothetical protein
MIGEVLVFLRDRLNDYIQAMSGAPTPDAAEDQVLLIDGEKMDPIEFRLGAITALLINIEQETTQRNADPYRVTAADGTPQRVQPEVRLNLYVLFVSRYKVYEQGLDGLSKVIRCFQTHRVFDHDNAPALSANVEKLVLELVTLPLSEQNEIWSALRVSYHPSVLYRVRMIVFRDGAGTSVPQVGSMELRLSQ